MNSPGQEGLWAEVILPLALPKTYTYNIPPSLQQRVCVGGRVEVNFGKNRHYAGIIRKLIHEQPGYPTKPVIQVLDEFPLVHEKQLLLWQWIADYYMCSEGEVMAAALPADFKLSSETILLFNEEAGDDFSSLDHDEFLVAEALLIRKQLQLHEVQLILESTHVYPVIKKLLEKNICFAWEKLQQRYTEKKENFVSLHPDLRDEEKLSAVLNDWKGAPKQMELLLAFLQLTRSGEVKQPELLKKAGATAAQLKALQEKDLLVVEKRSVDRIPVLPREMNLPAELSISQQQALENIRSLLPEKNVCLLHGVTSSGKTILYVHLMAEYMKAGKQVLYLLPEIALTSQVIRRLREYFGGYIAIYHSRFNDRERAELWNKVRNGEVMAVLGPRSALMLPFRDLGFIIVDEEHDPSYKQQDPAPRYHARDAAIYYASLCGARVLLGSGTPSLESYFNARSGKYGLIELKERYGGIEMPAIEVVNIAQVASRGKVMISPQLKEAVIKTVEEGKQVILFQNRRGYNPYMICGVCGFIPHCNHCDVSLTLHKFSNQLHCHYCGSRYPRLVQCPACGSTKWVEKNFGTEKIEEEVEGMFPGCRVARMDVDSIKGKHAHDVLIRQFEEHQVDILIGTQMVVKGLDFEKVALVGILDADGLLSFADFRVNERAFQLMEQVSGRSGRKHGRGRVLLQSLQVNHPVIGFVTRHDFGSLFDYELANRKEFNYPPFTRLIIITIKHKNRQTADDASEQLAAWLRQDLGPYLTGPAEPVIPRIRNQYLREIMIKLPRDSRVAALKKVILNYIQLLTGEKKFASVQVIPDVDPY